MNDGRVLWRCPNEMLAGRLQRQSNPQYIVCGAAIRQSLSERANRVLRAGRWRSRICTIYTCLCGQSLDSCLLLIRPPACTPYPDSPELSWSLVPFYILISALVQVKDNDALTTVVRIMVYRWTDVIGHGTWLRRILRLRPNNTFTCDRASAKRNITGSRKTKNKALLSLLSSLFSPFLLSPEKVVSTSLFSSQHRHTDFILAQSRHLSYFYNSSFNFHIYLYFRS